MTAVQLKSAIQWALENVPESVLPEILDYINAIQQQAPDKIKLKQFIDQVFKEDDKLLRRLAE